MGLTIKHNSQVVYVPFLDRFQNNLVQRSMMEWVNAVRPYLMPRLVRSPRAKNGAFNLYDLFEAMRDELHAIDLTAAYYFLKCNDSAKHPCTVTIKGLRNRTRGVEAKADGAVDLWALREFSGIEWSDFQDCWVRLAWGARATLADFDLAPIATQGFVELCMNIVPNSCSDEEARAMWTKTAAAIEKHGKVHWEALDAAIDVIGDHWTRATQVISVVKACSVTSMILDELFETEEISREAFAKTMAVVVGRKMDEDDAGIVFDMLDTEKTGSLPKSTIVEALEVVDTWVASVGSPRNSANAYDMYEGSKQVTLAHFFSGVLHMSSAAGEGQI